MGRIAKKIASCLFTTQKTMRVIEKGKVKKNCSLQNFKWYATYRGLIQVSSFRNVNAQHPIYSDTWEWNSYCQGKLVNSNKTSGSTKIPHQFYLT